MRTANLADGTQSLLHLERERQLRAKTYFFLLLMALLGPSSNVLLRVGMQRVGAAAAISPAALLLHGLRIFSNGAVLSGIATRILFTVASWLVLTWADYSFVTPVSAINYAIVALMGWSLLGESVSAERWIGIAVICLGVGLLTTTPTSTTARGRPGPQNRETIG